MKDTIKFGVLRSSNKQKLVSDEFKLMNGTLHLTDYVVYEIFTPQAPTDMNRALENGEMSVFNRA